MRLQHIFLLLLVTCGEASKVSASTLEDVDDSEKRSLFVHFSGGNVQPPEGSTGGLWSSGGSKVPVTDQSPETLWSGSKDNDAENEVSEPGEGIPYDKGGKGWKGGEQGGMMYGDKKGGHWKGGKYGKSMSHKGGYWKGGHWKKMDKKAMPPHLWARSTDPIEHKWLGPDAKEQEESANKDNGGYWKTWKGKEKGHYDGKGYQWKGGHWKGKGKKSKKLAPPFFEPRANYTYPPNPPVSTPVIVPAAPNPSPDMSTTIPTGTGQVTTPPRPTPVTTAPIPSVPVTAAPVATAATPAPSVTQNLPDATLADLVQSDYSRFYFYVVRAGRAEELETLQDATLFIPRDDALPTNDPYLNSLLEPGNEDELRRFVGLHIAPVISLSVADMPEDQALGVFVDNGLQSLQVTYFPDGSPVQVVVQSEVNEANVVKADVFATNGVLHELDGYLLPFGANT